MALLFPTLSPNLCSFGEGGSVPMEHSSASPRAHELTSHFIPSTFPGSHHPWEKPRGKTANCWEPAASVHSLPLRKEQSGGHPTLLSPPVAVDLIKDLFNKRGSEEREACHTSLLSDKALCDSLNLFPAS